MNNLKLHEKALLDTIKRSKEKINTLRSSIAQNNAKLEAEERRLGYAQSELAGIRTLMSEAVIAKHKGIKRKFDERQKPNDLISFVAKNSFPHRVEYKASTYISSQHVYNRKLRSLALCPVNDKLFATSAVDGLIKLWEVHPRGGGVSLGSSTNCSTPNQRRWPEDIAWHPEGDKIFSVYDANSLDSQISIMNLNSSEGKEPKEITLFEDKPHSVGIINNIEFMPWVAADTSFVTGGTDQAIILWSEYSEWKPQVLHKNIHTGSVMGVAGMQQKEIVLSVGKDKKVVGFDANAEREDFRHVLNARGLSVLPNPCDFNLYMIQAGTPDRQIRLFDIRTKGTELHSFGWKQKQISEGKTVLINQAWSPNGFFITSGSAHRMFHLFDIRFNSNNPFLSIEAHHNRVFKVTWLHSIPLLISISADNNIGLHNLV